MSCEEAIANTAFSTRRLAKKQRTWFGADPRITWYELSGLTAESNRTQINQIIEQVIAK
ncbi:hypothetical protein RQN30_02725 [Arcanobacterium hippocoleae]